MGVPGFAVGKVGVRGSAPASEDWVSGAPSEKWVSGAPGDGRWETGDGRRKSESRRPGLHRS